MLIGLPILRLRGVYFAMVTLVSTEVARLSALALPITNGARGIRSIPPPGPISLFGLTIVPDFATLAKPAPAFYCCRVTMMLVVFAAHLSPRQFADRPAVRGAAAERGARLLDRRQCRRRCGASPTRFHPSSVALPGRSSSAISQSIYPSSFTVNDSINFMLNCFLGGLGYVFGPMIGTFVLHFGWDLLFQTAKFQLLIYAARADSADAGPAERPPQSRRQRAQGDPLMDGILQVEHLTKRYGGLTAVSDVSFSLREREILSVIGPNGAGKSTLFKLIASFVSRPRPAGDIQRRTDLGARASPRGTQGVVRTFQEATIFKGMSVRDNVVVAHHLRSHANLLGFYLGTRAGSGGRGRIRPIG